jgi:DNA-binding response OmpR family regulator
MARGMVPDIRANSQSAEPQSQRRLRILVADDERDTVLTLVELLREAGHDARGVYKAREVLAKMSEFEPDVVLLDIAMPEMSGWDVARKIRETSAERPRLIAISGVYKESSDQILGKLAGFDYYVAKPYDPSVLLALIRDLA